MTTIYQPRAGRTAMAALALGLAGSPVGCSEPKAPPHVGLVPAPSVVAEMPSATVSPGASAASTASASASASAVAKPEAAPELKSPLRVELALRDGDPPCTFVIEASLLSEDDLSYFVHGISRIAVEESPLCAAATLFDAEAEARADPDAWGSLDGGRIPKPGHVFDAQADSDDESNLVTIDMDFDGHLDLDVREMMGAYNASHRDWIYDPQRRGFVRNEALEELMWPHFDAKKKLVTAGGRAGGPIYAGGEYAWNHGKLEAQEEFTTYLGQDPNGGPLPAGYNRWETRQRRVNGVMKKVFDGPVRDP